MLSIEVLEENSVSRIGGKTGAVRPSAHDLAGLLARLEASEGPDRALIVDIYNALGDQAMDRGKLGFVWREGGVGMWNNLPDLMSSLDAALALVERVLPGWGWEVRKANLILQCVGKIYEPDKPAAALMDPWPARYEALGRTPALALVLALVKALIARGGAGHGTASAKSDA